MITSLSSRTLVIQSHRDPLPFPWLANCVASVRHWAGVHDFDYRWLGDEWFSALPDDLWQKTRPQVLIASDLARLYAIQQALDEGYRQVIWCDADFLVIKPYMLQPPESPMAFGREVWIQSEKAGQLRARVKIHNAFMLFCQGNSFLPFYIDSAERLIRLNEGGMPPQYIGPKLLTALHNMLHFEVVENAGMLSPLVSIDLLNGGGKALNLFLRHHQQMPAGLNLSASLISQPPLGQIDMLQLIGVLQASG